MTMKRRQLSSAISEKLGLTAKDVDQVLETALDLLLEELIRTGRLEWRGLGTFSVQSYIARKIHNPATGKTIALSARKRVTFKLSVRLRSGLTPVRRPRPLLHRTSRPAVEKATS